MRMNFIDVPLAKYALLIPLINALSSFSLFNEDRTSLRECQLPFVENYKLLSAQSFSTIPPVTMHYLWNESNNDIIKMNGTREAVFDNLEKLRLVLNKDTAVPYVAFVLDNVQSDDGTLRLVQHPNEIDYSDLLSPQERQFLAENIKTATVVDEEEGFYITCNIVYGTTLFEAELRLEENGLFDFINERQIGEPIPALRQIFLE